MQELRCLVRREDSILGFDAVGRKPDLDDLGLREGWCPK